MLVERMSAATMDVRYRILIPFYIIQPFIPCIENVKFSRGTHQFRYFAIAIIFFVFLEYFVSLWMTGVISEYAFVIKGIQRISLRP